MTDKALRRDAFESIPDFVAAIEDYMSAHNDEPRPLTWTASAESIYENVARGRVAFNQAIQTRTDHAGAYSYAR